MTPPRNSETDFLHGETGPGRGNAPAPVDQPERPAMGMQDVVGRMLYGSDYTPPPDDPFLKRGHR